MLTEGGGSGGAASPPKDKNKLVEWVNDKLKLLSDALKCLAGKALAALPGVVGCLSLEQFLTFLAKAAGFAAAHVWEFLVFVVGAVNAWVFTQTTL